MNFGFELTSTAEVADPSLTGDNRRMVGSLCTGCGLPSNKQDGKVEQRDLGSADKWHRECYQMYNRRLKANPDALKFVGAAGDYDGKNMCQGTGQPPSRGGMNVAGGCSQCYLKNPKISDTGMVKAHSPVYDQDSRYVTAADSTSLHPEPGKHWECPNSNTGKHKPNDQGICRECHRPAGDASSLYPSTAAKPKGERADRDQPYQVAMRPRSGEVRRPSTDQRKVRRQLQRTAGLECSHCGTPIQETGQPGDRAYKHTQDAPASGHWGHTPWPTKDHTASIQRTAAADDAAFDESMDDSLWVSAAGGPIDRLKNGKPPKWIGPKPEFVDNWNVGEHRPPAPEGWHYGDEYGKGNGLDPDSVYDYDGAKTGSIKTAIRHLTLTGPYAGQTLCGAPRNEGDEYAHAAYAPESFFSDPKTCAKCRAVWASQDADADPQTAPDDRQMALFAGRKTAEVIARWESVSGKHWVTLEEDQYGYAYSSPGAGGSLGRMSRQDAINEMQMRVERGYFQPDAAKTPMKRVLGAAKTADRAALIVKDVGDDITSHVQREVPGATVTYSKQVENGQWVVDIATPSNPTNALNEWMARGEREAPFEAGALLYWTANPSGGFHASKTAGRNSYIGPEWEEIADHHESANHEAESADGCPQCQDWLDDLAENHADRLIEQYIDSQSSKTASRIDTINAVLDGGIYDEAGKTRKIDGAILDNISASVLKTVYDALTTDEARAGFERLPIGQLMDFAMSKVKIGAQQ